MLDDPNDGQAPDALVGRRVVAAALREVRWTMLGVIAVAGVGLLLAAFRFAPRPSNSVSQDPSQTVAAESVGPIGPAVAAGSSTAQPSVSAATSPGIPGHTYTWTGSIEGRPKSIMVEDQHGTIVGTFVFTATFRSTAAPANSTPHPRRSMRYEIATVEIFVSQGSIDYSPEDFSFIASDGHSYQPVDVVAATDNSLGKGHLVAGQSVTADVVFVVPAGKGKLEISGGVAQGTSPWSSTA